MILTLIAVLLGLWLIYDRLIDGWNLPPGPSRLPLIGSIIQMGRKSKQFPVPHQMMKEFCNEYGPITTLQYGLMRQVIVDDYEVIRQIFQSDAWLDRPVNKWMLERSFNKPLGILWGNGESWKEIRRFSIRTLRDFGFGKQKGQDAVMQEETEELFRRLDEKLELSGDSTICTSQLFTVSVLNILWSMMAGTRFSHDDAKLNTLVKQIYDNTRFINAAGNILMAFPFLAGVLRAITGIGKARKALIEALQKQFLELLHERRQLGYYKEDQRDFIDVFLMEIDKHKKDHPSKNFYTDEQFAIVSLDLFTAGSETTSNTLEFALLYMLLYPEIQEKVREEIETEIGRAAFPTLIMRSKLPFTEATLLEVQRIASVVPMTGRSPITDQTLLSYKIKKGTPTLLNLYSAHMNPKIWENPKEFRPERFLNSKKEIINADKLVPFGQGKRMCMGDILARSTLFTYFVRFFQNYKIEKSPSHPEPTTDCIPGLTLAPKPYHAIIKKRKH